MKAFKVLSILCLLFAVSTAKALIVNGKGFQQRGFKVEYLGNAIELVPMGSLPEVVVVGKQQVISILLQQRLHAKLGGQLSNYSGMAELFVISQDNGKSAKLLLSPLGKAVELPQGYTLRSESLATFEVKSGSIQPFQDLGSGNFLYTFTQSYDGFKGIEHQFSLKGLVPQNMGSAKVEFRLRLTASLSKPGWVSLKAKDGQEVIRFFVPMAARQGQVISVVKDVPNLALDDNSLEVVNAGVPMTEFKFRILELKTTRNYSAR